MIKKRKNCDFLISKVIKEEEENEKMQEKREKKQEKKKEKRYNYQNWRENTHTISIKTGEKKHVNTIASGCRLNSDQNNNRTHVRVGNYKQ